MQMNADKLSKSQVNAQNILNYNKKDLIFYSWECVSLVKRDRTIDFVINDRETTLAFINGMQHIISMSLDSRSPKKVSKA